MKTLSHSTPGCAAPDLSGYVTLPSGHTAGVTNLVGIAGDGVTPVYVPTTSVWQGFIAYRASSNQILPASSTTVLIHNAEVRDVLGLHDTTTGYFRPNKTGLWRITCGGTVGPTSGFPNAVGSYYDIRILKVSDSSTVCNMAVSRTFSTAVSPASLSPGSPVVYLTSGVDYAPAFNNGDGKDWQLFANETLSRLVVEFVAE